MFYILFTFLYLFLTAGLSITYHFCGGEVNSISLSRTPDDEDPCGDQCHTDLEKSCCPESHCKDEIKTIKLDDLHTFEAKFKQLLFSENSIIVSDEIVNNKLIDKSNYYTTSSQNLHINSSTYLFNCTFLI